LFDPRKSFVPGKVGVVVVVELYVLAECHADREKEKALEAHNTAVGIYGVMLAFPFSNSHFHGVLRGSPLLRASGNVFKDLPTQ
jgi:hypothetical protein